MLGEFFTKPAILRGHRAGLFGPYLDTFVAKLAELGYPRQTVRLQCCGIRDLGLWLDVHGLGVVELDEEMVGEYLEDRKRRGRFQAGGGAILRLFVDHLREQGAIPCREEVGEESPLERLVRQYAEHLKAERGVAPSTIDTCVPFARRFLVERFGERPPRADELQPADVSGFVLRWAHSQSPSRAKLMVTALRSFFRFLLSRGQLFVDLAAAVPTVVDWRMSTVPRHLSKGQIERLLNACDRSSATGRRDYALLILLARLGLRAGEVVAMELDDIDWRAGEICVRGKGSFVDRLPLPEDVGRALAAYLRQGRPRCSTLRVFVRAKAPQRGFASSAAVATIVDTALRRADLHPPIRGAHLLRHSLATEMLRGGASMAEIGQVLRHRSPGTTEIYAKVDLHALRGLAQPWPLGESAQ